MTNPRRPYPIGVMLDISIENQPVVFTNSRTGDSLLARVNAERVALIDAANFISELVDNDIIYISTSGKQAGNATHTVDTSIRQYFVDITTVAL